jgi:predicted lysophospholipase L1 biosynthesis ABC-type transport system permease subunit
MAMPRWSLVVLGLAAVLLATLPFGLLPGQYEMALRWSAAAALVLGALVAGKQNLALWCGVFAACAVAFNPLFPIDVPGRYETAVHVGAAVLTTICVVRHW